MLFEIIFTAVIFVSAVVAGGKKGKSSKGNSGKFPATKDDDFDWDSLDKIVNEMDPIRNT